MMYRVKVVLMIIVIVLYIRSQVKSHVITKV